MLFRVLSRSYTNLTTQTNQSVRLFWLAWQVREISIVAIMYISHHPRAKTNTGVMTMLKQRHCIQFGCLAIEKRGHVGGYRIEVVAIRVCMVVVCMVILTTI
ncbi:hypothetical protein L208DRAFT_877475 [Tricholoma matsutake]|nr:hypothetical protein L208DRAFT_877475 [Tricholoma matsutake 945]